MPETKLAKIWIIHIMIWWYSDIVSRCYYLYCFYIYLFKKINERNNRDDFNEKKHHEKSKASNLNNTNGHVMNHLVYTQPLFNSVETHKNMENIKQNFPTMEAAILTLVLKIMDGVASRCVLLRGTKATSANRISHLTSDIDQPKSQRPWLKDDLYHEFQFYAVLKTFASARCVSIHF